MTTCVIRCSISFLILVVFILIIWIPEQSHGRVTSRSIRCDRNTDECIYFEYNEDAVLFSKLPNEHLVHKRSIYGPFEYDPEETKKKVKQQWLEFWKDWFPQLRSHTHKELEKPVNQLCRESEDESSPFIDCVEKSNGERKLVAQCISAVSMEISPCFKLKKEDIPINLCREVEANRLEVCGDHISGGLCFKTEANPTPPINPCNLLPRSICMANSSLVYCPEDAFDNVPPSTEYKEWMKDWIPPIPDPDDISTRVKTGDLCYNKELPSVLDRCANRTACIEINDGTIGHCEEFPENIIHIPVCMQMSSRQLVACPKDWTSYLCFPEDRTESQKITPCTDRSRIICLDDAGKKVYCVTRDIGAAEGITPPVSGASPGAVTASGGETATEANERFMRIYCADCSVENELIVIGDPRDVEKEMETITFQPST